MTESNMTILDLSLDAWVAIGHHLQDADLARASVGCSGFYQQIMHNHSLWSYKFQECWGGLSQQLLGVHNWPGLYGASCLAASQLSTQNPWRVEIARPHAAEPPTVAQLLVSNSSSAATKDSYSSPRSALCIAASLDQKLLWCRMDSSTVAAVEEELHGQHSGLQALVDNVTAAAAPADSLVQVGSGQQVQQTVMPDKLCSDLQHGHTAFIDALVEVRAGNSIGYASGSRDKTIKLWSPFSCSSRTPTGHIRPVRTLRGHTGSITALLVLPACCVCSCSSNNRLSACCCNNSSYNSMQPPLLASASADKTIKVWSLASLAATSSACSSRAEAADNALDATTDDTNSSCSVRGSSSSGKQGGVGKTAQKLQQQQGRSPLLATLRGHSDCIHDLMLASASHSSSSSGFCGAQASKLLSCSRDCRIKMWDIDSHSCVATWKLPSPSYQLIDGLDICNSCFAALGSRAIMVLDTRVKGSTNSTSNAEVLTIPWPSGTLECASAYGSMIAGGGRKGVKVWDVRAALQGSSTGSHASSSSCKQGQTFLSSQRPGGGTEQKSAAGEGMRTVPAASSSASSSRVLFSASMPKKEPVTAVHINRVRLVAATSKVVLHSPASVAVWSVPDGRKLQELSSTESAITLETAARRLWHGHDADDADDTWELIQALSEPDANEAIRLMHQYHQQQQYAQEDQQQPEAQAQGHAWQADLHQPQQPQQQPQPLHAAVAAVQHPVVGAAQAYSASEDSDSATESDLSVGRPEAAQDVIDNWDAESAESRAAASSCYGRIEPGVVAIATHGRVLATVNTLGNIVFRDFSRGALRHKLLLPYCSSVHEEATIAIGNVASSSSGDSAVCHSMADSIDGSHDSPSADNHEYDKGQDQAQSAAANAAAAAATDMTALQLSKFWRA